MLLECNNRILLAGPPKLPFMPAARFFNIRHDPEIHARISCIYFYFHSGERMQYTLACRNITLCCVRPRLTAACISSNTCIIDATVRQVSSLINKHGSQAKNDLLIYNAHGKTMKKKNQLRSLNFSTPSGYVFGLVK